MRAYELDERVTWWEMPAKIVALIDEPSAIIELATGSRLTVGQSTLRHTTFLMETEDDPAKDKT